MAKKSAPKIKVRFIPVDGSSVTDRKVARVAGALIGKMLEDKTWDPEKELLEIVTETMGLPPATLGQKKSRKISG